VEQEQRRPLRLTVELDDQRRPRAVTPAIHLPGNRRLSINWLTDSILPVALRMRSLSINTNSE